MKRFFTRERIAAYLLALAALILALRLLDMTVLRPEQYADRIRDAWRAEETEA